METAIAFSLLGDGRRRPDSPKNSTMSLERISCGTRMSDVVVHTGVAYLSGKVPTDFSASFVEQTKDVLATIDKLLAQAGSDRSRMLRAEIFLKDIAHWAEMNTVWDAWVTPGATPARATVQAQMAHPDCLIEIMVTAAV